MSNLHPRVKREGKTVAAMVALYCRGVHGAETLCAECSELKTYALLRLEKCPFRGGKTTCVKCPVHCYHPEMREKIRKVMRYAGPRMMYRHPVKTVFHLIDGRRKEPVKN